MITKTQLSNVGREVKRLFGHRPSEGLPFKRILKQDVLLIGRGVAQSGIVICGSAATLLGAPLMVQSVVDQPREGIVARERQAEAGLIAFGLGTLGTAGSLKVASQTQKKLDEEFPLK